ncbi:MAG TPA: aminopeptidase P family protein [Desulfobaccales bacterium]|nr:aminopeptidase P family protein [Desulfobaccales bacterium]
MTNPLLPIGLTAVRELFPGHEIDALLVSGTENRRYLSGFTAEEPNCGMLLISASGAWLLTDFRYQSWAQQEVRDIEVVIYQVDFGETLGELLKEMQVGRLGFEAGNLSFRQYQRLTGAVAEAGVKVAWQPLDGLVEGLRQRKTEAELAIIRRALDLTETVMRQVAGELTPGLTEGQVAWEIEKRLREGGAEALAFPPIVAAGPNSAQPHHHPGDYRLKAGEPIIIDMGARVDGYCADLTRTFILGSADEHFRKIYSLVRRAQVRAEQELKAGMDSLTGDALAREVIAAAGYGEAFGHSLGHGVGLAVHEPPSLSPFEARRSMLPDGCVVTVEPGIYLTGWGGVRLEDMVCLRAEGAEVLNGLKDFYEWD